MHLQEASRTLAQIRIILLYIVSLISMNFVSWSNLGSQVMTYP